MALHYIKVKEVAAQELAEGDVVWTGQWGWLKVSKIETEYGMVDVHTVNDDGEPDTQCEFEKDELVLIKTADQS